ncbi:YlbF family regulator [Caenibacillus caldisaponilyticus]|uniref:YlbF family regulator n=1 Tax=Caenibacillus caldisaponilyticus TaxID=1674942 RepID=UPI0009885C61|nr:YlbF family regulator [Caenibacillus caldisaponilyticus]
MIATLEHLQLLDAADRLVDMLTESDVFARYRLSKDKLARDEEALALIRRFVRLREKYDEVQRFGKYHPDYKTVIKEMMEVKRELDMNDAISAYKKAEDDLNTLLYEISAAIANAVSPSIKVPTGDPFFDRGCGGGCGVGGACGCH